MAKAQEHKARGGVRRVANLIYMVHVVKWLIAVLLIMLATCIGLSKFGEDCGDGNTCVSAKYIDSIFPEIAILTAEEKSWVAAQTFILGFLGLALAIAQISGMTLLLDATEKDMKQKLVPEMLDYVMYIQLGVLFGHALFFGVCLYFPGFSVPLFAACGDVIVSSSMIFILSDYICQFKKEEFGIDQVNKGNQREKAQNVV
ncbi:unnamed protein product [Orchesella dallaii]|uniref:Uncharacterized protein n=1 Tax=Orchesella dallaii TaxID=48710 RepID=A0ABP1QCH0_9HEXA